MTDEDVIPLPDRSFRRLKLQTFSLSGEDIDWLAAFLASDEFRRTPNLMRRCVTASDYRNLTPAHAVNSLRAWRAVTEASCREDFRGPGADAAWQRQLNNRAAVTYCLTAVEQRMLDAKSVFVRELSWDAVPNDDCVYSHLRDWLLLDGSRVTTVAAYVD